MINDCTRKAVWNEIIFRLNIKHANTKIVFREFRDIIYYNGYCSNV